jgi:putative ABC transport system permease protein
VERPKPPKVPALMRPFALIHLYREWLRAHAVQELLAGVGVAIAVALAFATLLANASIAGSTDEVVHAVVGSATLQLRAQGPDGFDERMLVKVEHLAGVKQAAPLLEQTATLVGPHGKQATVDIAGTNVGLAILNGLAHTLPVSALSPGGVGLSKESANALGITSASASGSRQVLLKLRGGAHRMNVSAVLGPETFGALSRARVAVMPLDRLQLLAGLRGRISRILVEAKLGREDVVRAELQRLAGRRLLVAPADQDLALLRQALGPSNQASELFAAISALLGFLFAFNAMLLTIPERRQAIADMRIDGTRRTAIVQMVLFQALCLGLAASLVGLLAGYVLSRGVFQQAPGYLSQAFTLGTKTVVGAGPVLLALAGGLLATCLASMVPLLDLRRKHAVDAVYFEEGAPGNALSSGVRRRLFATAIALVAIASALFILAPSDAIAASVLLALATVFTVPLVLMGVLHAAGALAHRYERLTSLPVALASLRAAPLRSLALAATGALALFGSVALGGSRSDLLRGIDGYTANYVAGADVWLVNPGDNQATSDFSPDRYSTRIGRVPGVLNVHTFQGSFLDLGDRRIWVIAWPARTPLKILDGQVIEGDATAAAARLREGGWITVSQQIAAERGIGVGDGLNLPSASGPVRLKIAATTSNFGWSPGAIAMSAADYSRSWQTRAPTALGVDLTPGTNALSARRDIEDAIAPSSGLEVLSAQTREAKIDASASDGLSQLGEISTLLVAAAILAMIAALGSNIWQRRISLSGLRLEGSKPDRLRRILAIEAGLILGAGCLTGAVAGVYGQLVIDGYLKHVTAFPVAGIAAGGRPLEILLLVLLAVLAVVTVPGWWASRVSPTLALDE